MDIQDTPGIRRRMRASDLGSGSSASGAVFDRNAALKEAVTLGVCLEDRAQLEALARFAFASPGFRAQTTVRVGDDRSEQVRFEVVHTDQGPKVRVAPDDAAPTSDENVNEALELFTVPDGPVTIAVCGAVASTLHVREAGVASTFPTASVARTSNV